MLLIKAAYLKISLSPDENAGRGDGGQFLSQYCAREVTVIVAWQTFVRMGGDTATAKNNPRVLNPVVGINQSRPNRRNVGLERLTYHLFEPIWRNDSQIIVQEGNELRLYPRDAKII